MRSLLAALTIACALILSGCTFSLLPPLNLTTSDLDSDVLEAVVAKNPDNAHAWFLLGRERLDREENRRARRAFRRAVEIQPEFEEAHLGIGISYLNSGRWSRARSAFEAVLAFHAESTDALGGIAEAELGRGDLEAAEEAAMRALALQPRAATANRVLGDIRYIEGEYRMALAHWGVAVQEGAGTPWLPPLMDDLARFLEKYE